MLKFDRELFCQESFDRFLREQGQYNDLVWERVPEGQDPPDFYLTLETEHFAVEMTSTKIFREVALGSGSVIEQTYEASHTAVVREVQNKAEAQGILSGVYIVDFARPMSDERFRQVKKAVIGNLLAYIQKTQDLIEAESERIFYQNREVCRIGKVPGSMSGVYEAFNDTAWPEAPETTDKVCQMLQATIAEKQQKLRNEGAPKILLLLNTYDFATPGMYADCVKKNPAALDFFHTVFVVWGNGNGCVLHAVEPDWLLP